MSHYIEAVFTTFGVPRARNPEYFVFHEANGELRRPHAMVLQKVRPGVDGFSLQHIGVRAERSEIYTFVSVNSRSVAENLVERYRAMEGGAPLRIIRDGIDYAANGYVFHVVDTDPIKINRFAVSTAYEWGLTFRWGLIGAYADPNALR